MKWFDYQKKVTASTKKDKEKPATANKLNAVKNIVNALNKGWSVLKLADVKIAIIENDKILGSIIKT